MANICMVPRSLAMAKVLYSRQFHLDTSFGVDTEGLFCQTINSLKICASPWKSLITKKSNNNTGSYDYLYKKVK